MPEIPSLNRLSIKHLPDNVLTTNPITNTKPRDIAIHIPKLRSQLKSLSPAEAQQETETLCWCTSNHCISMSTLQLQTICTSLFFHFHYKFFCYTRDLNSCTLLRCPVPNGTTAERRHPYIICHANLCCCLSTQNQTQPQSQLLSALSCHCRESSVRSLPLKCHHHMSLLPTQQLRLRNLLTPIACPRPHMLLFIITIPSSCQSLAPYPLISCSSFLLQSCLTNEEVAL